MAGRPPKSKTSLSPVQMGAAKRKRFIALTAQVQQLIAAPPDAPIVTDGSIRLYAYLMAKTDVEISAEDYSIADAYDSLVVSADDAPAPPISRTARNTWLRSNFYADTSADRAPWTRALFDAAAIHLLSLPTTSE